MTRATRSSPGRRSTTIDAGAHTLEVDCYSGGGGDVSLTVAYKVKANTLTAVKTAKTTDFVSFKTAVPAGKIVAKLVYGAKKTVIGTTTINVAKAKTASVTVKPTAAGKKTLLALKGKSAKVTLQVSFTPKAIGTGDQQIAPAGATVVTRTVNEPIAQPRSSRPGRSSGGAGTRRRRRAVARMVVVGGAEPPPTPPHELAATAVRLTMIETLRHVPLDEVPLSRRWNLIGHMASSGA